MSNQQYDPNNPQAGWQPAQPYQPKKRSKGKIALIVISVILVGLVGFGGCVAVLASSTDGSPTDPNTISVPSETTATQAPKSAAPKLPRAQVEDGTWMVPSEMKPGTYRSGNNTLCYWARLKGTSGDFDDIIINGNGANQTVTIKATDKAFQHSNCGGWKKLR
jgi:hypothetical protein